MKSIKLVALVILASGLFSETAFSQSLQKLPNFQKVNEEIYRSGRPGSNDLATLQKKFGVQSVINIEDNEAAVKHEKQVAGSIGMEFLSFPIATRERPPDEQVNRILSAMRDSKNFPTLIHCMHGEDRTGLLVGLYRVEVEGWPPEKAYKEMLSLGYHPHFKELDQYFRDRTGYRGN